MTRETYAQERATAERAQAQHEDIARQVEAYCAGVAAMAAQATAQAMAARGHQATARHLAVAA